ncbi:dorsal-ventral patterning tolloid-like protein 1 isoform X2 [Haliotis rubra]|uniref:dorsal-ventral patterning tolloid-like protein 1 isoform X2 n=1 Tax=Haliotis rubra TaxID=36100 RepID=UPI001EE51D26|nr:dorsal-ventral patterning tolloid-like protein 1 isoform X2 [Haliotis rubra]
MTIPYAVGICVLLFGPLVSETGHVFDCGSSFLSANISTWGVLSSPGYPNYNYSNNMDCRWTITAPGGHIVKVDFENISLDDKSCAKDYLNISDGPTPFDPRLGIYCDDITGYIVSSGSAMTITFHTDSSVTDRGFSLKYIAWIRGCGGHNVVLSNETKYISSPNRPFSYPKNVDCEWTISTSIEGYVIHVTAPMFDIEYGSRCTRDYVELYDVTGTNETSLGRWCRSDGPDTESTGQRMKVRFHSDDLITRSGFILAFVAGEPTTSSSDTGAPNNLGAVLGGVFGGIAALGIASCCCYRICSRKKAMSNEEQQRNRSREDNVSFINIPSYAQTTPSAPTAPSPSAPTAPSPTAASAPTVLTPPSDLEIKFQPPPSYNDILEDDPPPYCQTVHLSDIQPVVTSSHISAFEYQEMDTHQDPFE